MKRLNYVLSFLLLMVFSLSASAQTLKLGDQLTEIPTDGTTQVILQTATGTAFWDGNIANPTDVTDNCAAVFVPTGKQVDGYDTYYIQQVSTGKYLKNYTLYGGQDSSDLGVDIGTTDNKSEAFVATILPYDANGGFRTAASNAHGYQDPAGGGLFVICSEYTYENAGETVPTYFGWYGGAPFMSPYEDTNGWYIYSTAQASGAEMLEKAITAYFPSGIDEGTYPTGNQPGYYSTEAYNNAKTAYDEAQALLSSGEDITEAQATEMSQKLKEASEALANGIVPITTGYYFFMGPGRNETAASAGKYAMYDNGSVLAWNTTEYTIPEELTESDAKYIFHVTVNEDGTLYIKNLYTGLYPQSIATSESVKTGSEAVPYSYAATSTVMPASFNFWATADNSSYHKLHEANGGSIVGWCDATASAFQVKPVDESQIEALAEAVAKAQRLKELNTLVSDAELALHKATSYKADADNLTEDGCVIFDDLGLAGDASQLTCNNLDSSEGNNIAALIDNDPTTYIHTSWHSTGTHTEYHYVQADLGEAVNTVVIQLLKRQGAANDHLKTFRLLATNDTTGTWADQGVYAVNYELDAVFGEDTLKSAAAITGATLDGSYRFIRIEGLTTSTARSLSYPYWHAAEMRFYSGSEDTENSTLGQVDEAVVAALKTQLAASKAAIKSGDATQAQIDAMQKAYDDFEAQIPDPSRITSVLGTFSSAYIVYYYSDNGEVGSFPTSAKTAAQEVILDIQNQINNKKSSEWTVADVNAAITKINEARTALDAQMVMPTAGTLYVIRTATTGTASGRAANAPIYVKNSGLSSGLYYMAPNQAGTDSVDVATHYNYVWLAESVDAENKTVTLRNLYTGRYIGQQESAGSVIPASAEPVALSLVPARDNSKAAVDVVVNNAEDNVEYINTGANGNIVAWNEGTSGLDNSAFTFSTIDLAEGEGLTYVPVTAGQKQIVTLPFAAGFFSGEGTAYTSTAIDATSDDVITLEALDMTAEQVVTAGEPFVYEATEGETEVPVYIVLGDDGMPAWSFETKYVNGLVGVIDGASITDAACAAGAWIYSSGNLLKVPASAASYIKNISANSGYICADASTGVKTVETTTNSAAANGKIFDLQGRRVVKAEKGLYIINGKKVLVK